MNKKCRISVYAPHGKRIKWSWIALLSPNVKRERESHQITLFTPFTLRPVGHIALSHQEASDIHVGILTEPVENKIFKTFCEEKEMNCVIKLEKL